jgi:sugar phosphate isomerase/epimerase
MLKKKSADMQISPPATLFKIGAPSMIYGKSMERNAERLSRSGNGLDFIEIVLFHTPQLHNIPTARELQTLKEIQERTQSTYTVHLPASLDIASKHQDIREKSIRMIVDIWHKTSILQPAYYVLHIPMTPPTLVSVPGQYIKSVSPRSSDDWTSRAMDSLGQIRDRVGNESALLLENINYSPRFLEPFFKADHGGFCLDIGHLLLGDEHVMEVMERFRDQIREIHLHGVRDYTEHLSLNVMPRDKVAEWLSCLQRWNFQGYINLEVFSPEDLKSSLEVVSDIIQELSEEVC